VALSDLQPYIDDALDLIEFANGSVYTKWGKVRAEMGHPKPFDLKEIGIGNEQWGPLYPERLEKFVKAIRAKYPDIKICGSSGPSSSGKDFDYGWEQMRKIGVDLVDEHYYMSPDWFLKNADRYDNYSRKGPKVFAGEYAAHARHDPNSWEAALSEAAFMTGLERNADVVYQATYAPLFAHIDGWQWRPDLIWFDNLSSVRSANWYVQMLYGTNKGTNVLKLTENGKAVEGRDGLYASAVYDAPTKNYVVKMVNASDASRSITVTLQGARNVKEAKVITLHADDIHAENTLENKDAVKPVESDVSVSGNQLSLTIPAKTFVVYRF
jgi:alpha-L-arabinofuranosidase